MTGRAIRGPWPDETRFIREHRRLNPVAERELGEDAGHVGLDGPLADEELPGDLGVGQPAGNEAQDIQLALAEAAERALNCIARSGPGHVLFDDAARDLWCEQGVTGFIGGGGTAMSPPLPTMVLFAAAITASASRRWVGTLGAVAVAAGSIAFTIGQRLKACLADYHAGGPPGV